MKKLLDQFEKLKNSNDSLEAIDQINDFLVSLGKTPQIEYLQFIDFFKENSNPNTYESIKINLIYDLGEIGRLEKVDVKYLDYLIKEYYKSDRWIRNEIINAFEKIQINQRLSERVIELISHALNEDYNLIKNNALKTLLYAEELPTIALKNILKILNSSDTILLEHCTNVLQKVIINENGLFNLLNFEENYKILNKSSFRKILLIFYKLIINIKSFREKILKSSWDIEYIAIFLKEIDTFDHIITENL